METLLAIISVSAFLTIPISCLRAMFASPTYFKRRKSSVPGWILFTWIVVVLVTPLIVAVNYRENGPRNPTPADYSFGYIAIIGIVILLNVWIEWSVRPK